MAVEIETFLGAEKLKWRVNRSIEQQLERDALRINKRRAQLI